ncbi:uracil-DNA glycosylase family protein [Bacteroidota bacterium]
MNFGYPDTCKLCIEAVKKNFDTIRILGLKVRPFYQPGMKFKLMLIGQDPTIKEKQERVKKVLMLDQENSQLRRWLKGIFGPSNFDSITIYATNVVKCTFSQRPSVLKKGGRELLNTCFSNCREYLIKEILMYSPDLILSLGEPSHELFLKSVTGNIPLRMKDAFSGKFYEITIENFQTHYSPCLHIQTFRVAEKYGVSVNNFKKLIKEYNTA